ncbi:MAG: ParB/RepB/Spo0J family partition protein [Phascolarctobacterium sp.]|nr:ParB/RepB/Spo0J family partition protein [Phascolarctobacterium sp.]
MLVDDGFSVLDTEAGILNDRQTVREVQVIKVPTEKIFPNPYQPRKTFEDEALADLSASIAQYGVLQPLLVAPAEDGRYLLIAGERRLRASRMANVKEVPVIVSEYTTQQIAEIALIENLQREDLHFMEEAEGYEQLMNQFHLTQEAMAARVGKKQSTIANKLRLLRLSSNVRKIINDAELSERHARALLKIEDEAKQIEVLNTVIAKGLNVRQTEALIDKQLEDKPVEKRKRVIIVNDVRIYLNSIKKIVGSIKDVGIPVEMEQSVEGDEVIVSLRIKNMKKPKK